MKIRLFLKFPVYPGNFFTKTLLVMKLTIFLIFLGCIHVSAAVYSQTVTLKENNASLELIFKEIKHQTGYSFMFNSSILAKTKPITINVKNISITEALDICLKDQPLTYDIIEKIIAIKEKPEKIISELLISDITFINIHGRVLDENNKPAPGVTVTVKGTKIVTVTDESGGFNLKTVDKNAILVFSSVNMEPFEIKVNGKMNLEINLKTKIATLGNVEIVYSTGYQSIPMERATGSFAQPIKEMYDNRISFDPITKLEGITSGLVFNTPGITGSDKSSINIRGRSTIFANDQPLIVLDNFPFDGDINNINPNDIESVTILKDASAASIWGVRSGNGVIVITTKKGKMNQALRINLNANVTISQKQNLFYSPQYLDANDFINVEQSLFSQGFYDGQLSDPTGPPVSPVVDILNQERNGAILPADADQQINALRNNDVRRDISKYFYRNQVQQQYALNVSGGSNKDAYYFSGGYDNNLTGNVGNKSDRITINSLNTFSPVNNLSVTAGLNFAQSHGNSDNTINELPTAGGLYGALYPYAKLANNSGSPLQIVHQYSNAFVNSAPQFGFLDWRFFPLQELHSGWNINTVRTNYIKFVGGLKYDLFPWLSAEFNYQYENSNSSTNALNDQKSFYTRNLINQFSNIDMNGQVTGQNIPIGDILNNSNPTYTTNNFRAHLNLNRVWNKSSLYAIAGFEQREIINSIDGYTLYGYNPNTSSYLPVDNVNFFNLNPSGYGSISSNLGLSGSTDRYRSYFGNAAYSYNDRYTFSISGRIDQSNYFGVSANEKSVPLWSIGGKWDINKENFYHMGWLPNLDLRITYGYNGNLDKSLTALTTLGYSQGAPLTNANYAYLSNIGNPDLKWEKIGMVNLGIDFSLYRDIISGSFEYFHKNGTDLIGDEDLPPSSGILQFRGNFADMTGQGMDIKLTSKIINRGFKLTTTFLLSWASDKVTKYNTTVNPIDLTSSNTGITPIVGKPVYTVYSLKWAGLDSAGNPRGYINGKQISEDYGTLTNPDSIGQLVYKGPARPTFFGGLNTHISYRKLAVSFNLSYKFGYYFRRTSINYTSLYNTWIGNSDFSKRWQKPGDEKNTNVPSMIYPIDPNRDLFYQLSEPLVTRGDHVRFQDIILSYDIRSNNKISKTIKSAQIYIYLNNIGILWKANKNSLDPDYPNGGLPPSRSISFGIKAAF